MAFTLQDLYSAIGHDDLDRVQLILADRDEHGIPKVNLNAIDGNYLATPLMYAVRCGNQEIAQALLDVRDNSNNPVVNLNKRSAGQTVISELLDPDAPITSDARRQILQRIFNTRGPAGQLLLDVNAYNGTRPLVFMAVLLGDAAIIRMLFDVYNEHGQRYFDVNARYPRTALQYAVSVDASPEVLQAIREAQEQPPPLPENKRQPAQPLQPDPSVEPEIKRLLQNTQSTHNNTVTYSVRDSVLRLKERYPNINSEKCVREIKLYLNASSSPYKNGALNCLARVGRIKEAHALCNNVTLSEVLALVWHGVLDKRSSPNGNLFNDKDIAARKRALIKNLHEAQNTYGQDSAACFVGTFNKFVETLDRVHRDIEIAYTSAQIKSLAAGRIMTYVTDELKKETLAKQKNILASWNDEVLDEKGESETTKFKKSLPSLIRKRLEKDWGALLTPADRDGMVNGLEYLNKPIPHEELRILVEKIEFLRDDKDLPARQVIVDRLRGEIKHIFAEDSKEFVKEHKNLSSIEVTVDLICKLDELGAIISQLEDKENNENRSGFIATLKKLAETAYEKDLSKAYNELSNELNIFNQADAAKKSFVTVQNIRTRFSLLYKIDPENQQLKVALQKMTDELWEKWFSSQLTDNEIERISESTHQFLNEAVAHKIHTKQAADRYKNEVNPHFKTNPWLRSLVYAVIAAVAILALSCTAFGLFGALTKVATLSKVATIASVTSGLASGAFGHFNARSKISSMDGVISAVTPVSPQF